LTLPAWLAWSRDGWLVATLLTAMAASVTACVYFFNIHALALDDDAATHMRLARGVFDAVTPGLAQIGTVWLPLPDVLLWPFVWNDYLWRTGLAGALAAMPCFVIASVYLYRVAYEVSGARAASFAGALAFVLNPNILYLQTTALTEPLMLALTAAAGYYFLRWVKTDTTQTLLATAFCMFLATLTRYEGWSLLAALTVLIAVIGLLKRRPIRRVLGEVLTFFTPGGLGIALWLAWNALITGNPLYFENGGYSPKAQQAHFLEANTLPTYHNLGQSLLTYAVDLLEVAGPVVVALAVVALAIYGWRFWRSAVAVALLAFLSPIPLHVLALYSGATVLYVPRGVPSWIQDPYFNSRYSIALLIPISVFIATLIPRRRVSGVSGALSSALLVAVIVAQAATLTFGGIVTVQESQQGLACLPLLPAESYLIEHYNGGRILLDISDSYQINFAEAGIHLSNVIYDGSNGVWSAALDHPERYASWVIATPGDRVTVAITDEGRAFTDRFVLVQVDSSGRELFFRRDLPPLPTRAVPSQLIAEHSACNRVYDVSPAPANQPATPASPSVPLGPHAETAPPIAAAPSALARQAISRRQGAPQ
jgi:hypothetical protein